MIHKTTCRLNNNHYNTFISALFYEDLTDLNLSSIISLTDDVASVHCENI